MPTISKWSGVAVSVESASAATKTISVITKANPAVATSTAHGYSNGDEVALDILGMNQLDDRVVRVANVTANTFELEGVDSTLYDTFSSGTASKITFGTSLSIVRSLTASGGDPEFIDITTIHDTVRSQTTGALSPGSFSLELFWDPGDTGFLALKSAADAQSLKAMKFAWPNGRKLYFRGYVAASGLPTGTAQDLVTTAAAFTIQGRTTQYSS